MQPYCCEHISLFVLIGTAQKAFTNQSKIEDKKQSKRFLLWFHPVNFILYLVILLELIWGNTVTAGMPDKTSKSRFKNPDAKDLTEEISSKEIDDSSASVLNGSAMKNTLSLTKETATVLVGAKKRQKLHWGYHQPLIILSSS